MICHISPWHCYQSQEAEATQVMGPRRQSTTIAPLNGHNIKLTPSYLLLYMEMRASLRSHQERLLLQEMVIDKDSQLVQECRIRNCGVLSPK